MTRDFFSRITKRRLERKLSLIMHICRSLALSLAPPPFQPAGRPARGPGCKFAIKKRISAGGRHCLFILLSLPGGPAGYRERLRAKNFESFYSHIGQKFFRTISPYNLPDRPVHGESQAMANDGNGNLSNLWSPDGKRVQDCTVIFERGCHRSLRLPNRKGR